MDIYLSEYALYDRFESMCYTYPRFTMEICDTIELNKILDDIRSAAGSKPFFNGDDIDDTRWYDFYVVVNLETMQIESVYGDCYPNDEISQEIPIDKADVLRQVKQQLKKKFNTTLEELKQEYLTEVADYE